MPVDRRSRICVVGGGAAGVSAAVALSRLGYRRVTLVEKSAAGVGGKCRTVARDGLALDTGAIYVLPNCPTVVRHVRMAGAHLRAAVPFIHIGEDGTQRPFGTPPRPVGSAAKAAEYARLGMDLLRYHGAWRRDFGEMDGDTAEALSLPYAEWMERRGLRYFHAVAYPLLRSFGFGFEEQRIPAAYILKSLPQFAHGGNLLRLWDVGGIRLGHVEEGYGEVWRRLAAGLDVRAGAAVIGVERGERGGVARTEAGEIPFDALVLACPLDGALGFLDASPEERDLFGRIKSFGVWQAIARIEGVPEAAIIDANQRQAAFGRAMILLRYRRSAPWYYVFGYGAPGQDDAQVARTLDEDMRALGGRVEGEPVVHRWWGYFPHFEREDFAAGCHARLERLQGRRATYYVGEILSDIGVESVVSYAVRLIERRFGGAG